MGERACGNGCSLYRRQMESRSILVVDDDREIRELLEHALTLAGYEVRTATNGAEALASLTEKPVEVLITDLIMPEKDGVQLISELRKSQPQVRVVAMTGGGHISSDQYLKLARAFGAQAVLTKPFSHAELLATMAKLLPSERREP
jgi:CheY-like chemotaxis protein